MTRLSKKRKQIMKNRLWATLLAFLGYLTTLIDGDSTAFILLLLIALTVFFKEDVVIH